MHAFVSGTGTGVGKTWLTRSIALALRARGESVVALKPLETGCAPHPHDAIELAEACGRPALAHEPGFYRAQLPVAPWAATLEGETPPDFDALVAAVQPHLGARHLLVEGAGGVLVPIDPSRTMLDLADALDLPLVLVAHDGLGVLSHTLTACEAATRRAIPILAVVLREAGLRDSSTATNLDILRDLAGAPVYRFPLVSTRDDMIAAGEALLTRMQRSR